MLPEALPYHLKVRDYFKQQTSTWEFFAAARTREEQLVSFQTELLKNTYQFRRETDPALYEKIDLAREKLGLGALQVTAYQAQYTNDPDVNASIVYLHQQAHLVFSGPILERLNEPELQAVIAHELTHIRLYTLLDGDLEVADRIITAIANNYNSEPPYAGKPPSWKIASFPHPSEDGPSASASVTPFYETARLFKLYTEIYCDRGAYAVVGHRGPVITSLVKIATGLSEVNAEGYSQQADAIFSAEPGTQSAMPTHPENFIRTRALRLWEQQQVAGAPDPGEGGGVPVFGEGPRERANEDAISRMIEGQPELDRLDLFSQRELNDLTKLFLQEYLRPAWFHSTLVMGLASEYFSDIRFAGGGEGAGGSEAGGKSSGGSEGDRIEGGRRGADRGDGAREKLMDAIAGAHSSVREYFAYVLLDFALADPSLEEMPAGRAFEFAADIQLTATYEMIYKKELQLSDKKWQQHKQKVQAAYESST